MQLTNYQNFFFASRPIPQTAELNTNGRPRFDQVESTLAQPCLAGTNVNILPAGKLAKEDAPLTTIKMKDIVSRPLGKTTGKAGF